MRARAILTAFLCVAGFSPAQVPPRDAPQPQIGTASIRGRVVAADTGAPIRDNVITLTAIETSAPATARTDNEGWFRFTGLAAGRYRLRVSVGPASARYLEDEQIVQLADKQVVDRLEVKLRRARPDAFELDRRRLRAPDETRNQGRVA